MVGGGHQSCHWGVMMDTRIRGLKQGCPVKDVTNDNKGKNKLHNVANLSVNSNTHADKDHVSRNLWLTDIANTGRKLLLRHTLTQQRTKHTNYGFLSTQSTCHFVHIT